MVDVKLPINEQLRRLCIFLFPTPPGSDVLKEESEDDQNHSDEDNTEVSPVKSPPTPKSFLNRTITGRFPSVELKVIVWKGRGMLVLPLFYE
jgi:hypothetical protein